MRFFLDSDNSGHWYLVDAAHAKAWSAWLNLDEDDPEGWTPPAFARRIDSPSAITFTDPEGM